MRKSAILLLLIFSVSLCAQSPTPIITPTTKVNTLKLRAWLHSGDPRLVAWAADFAHREHNQAILAEIPAILDGPLVGTVNGKEQYDQNCATLALLDALLQEKRPLPVATIKHIAPSYPAQAILFLRMLPIEESRPTLNVWALREDKLPGDVKSHAAAMILAKTPDSYFVSHILSGIKQYATIRIVDKNSFLGMCGGATGCGTALATTPSPGWPTIYLYRLEERQRVDSSDSTEIIRIGEIGERVITISRFDIHSRSTGCSSNFDETSFRYDMVAYWLGIKPSEMTWQITLTKSIFWTNNEDYERVVGDLLKENRAKIAATIDQLKKKKLLDDDSDAFPKVKVAYECEIKPCPVSVGGKLL